MTAHRAVRYKTCATRNRTMDINDKAPEFTLPTRMEMRFL